jgi:pimeloyl-ACP methyl ester carboxylesterase
MKIRKPAFYFLFIVVYFFVFSLSTLAADVNNVDFTDDSMWEFSPNNGIYTLNNSYLKFEANNLNTNMFPYLRTVRRIFPEDGPLDIFFDYKYLGDVGFGAGIALSPDIPHPNKTDISRYITDYVLFNIWQGGVEGFYIYSWVCPSLNANCVLPVEIPSPDQEILGKYDFTNHIVRIEYTDEGVYKVYFDGSNSPVFTSIPNQRRPYGIWIGNSVETNTSSSWSSFEVNNISYESTTENVYPTILIPGLGASWDVEAILNGTEGTNWEIPSFVKSYEGLKTSFINAGYSETNDPKLFTFSYDWRRPLDTLADRLNEYIIEKVPTGKINLVGHSMGGLVARAYAQKYGVSKINKILTIGSPNMGATEAYSVWEGATVWNDVWWAKLALELTTHFGAIPGDSKVQTVQKMAPSIKDLLPTYDFLRLEHNIIPWSSLNQKNTYLANINQNITSIDSLTSAIFSNDIQTNAIINVTPPSPGDIGWIDGKPIDINPFETILGDGTVTESSAKGPFTNTTQGSGWHGELVTKSDNIQKILSQLGLATSNIILGEYDSRTNVLVAALRSPGILDICNVNLTSCNSGLGGIYLPDEKLFMLPGYSNENLIVRVTEKGLGGYSVHLGNINNNAYWNITNGSLDIPGQVDYYNVERNGNILSLAIDKSGPTVPIIIGSRDPELKCGGTTNRHMATVDWTDSSDKNGVNGYDYIVDYPLGNNRGQWNAFFTNSEYRGSLNEGVHYIKVRAKDRFENYSSWSNVCSITADWTAPTVAIISPINGTYRTDTLPKLKYSATDNLDNKLKIVISGMPKSEGQHTVTVSAIDNAGNTGTASVIYTIKNPKPSEFCKQNGWRYFYLFHFRNQGECVKYFNLLDLLQAYAYNPMIYWGWVH